MFCEKYIFLFDRDFIEFVDCSGQYSLVIFTTVVLLTQENDISGILCYIEDTSNIYSNKILSSVNSEDTFDWIFECLKECVLQARVTQKKFIPEEQKLHLGRKKGQLT